MKLRIFFLVIFLPLVVGVGTGGFLAISRGTPSVSELKGYRVTPGTRVYANDDSLIGELRMERGVYMPVEKVPQHLIDAVVAVEDGNFWRHGGIDYTAILRAAITDIISRKIKQGGSTITQQLAKITFLTPERTFKRKLREAALAIKIEKYFTKEEILDHYLNRVYFGHGAYGVEMASQSYFGKTVSDIELHEAALLAGLLKAPSAYSPFNNIKKAKRRQRIALQRMEDEGFITPLQRKAAEKKPIDLTGRARKSDAYRYFVDYIRKYLVEKYGLEKVLRGNMRVYTTLEPGLQLKARDALRKGLRALDKRRGWRGPMDHREEALSAAGKPVKKDFKGPTLKKGDIVTGLVLTADEKEAVVLAGGVEGTLTAGRAKWARKYYDAEKEKTLRYKEFNLKTILTPGDVIKVGVHSNKKGRVDFSLEQEPEVEGALVSIDPRTGYIRSMVGGYDYRKSQYNRAVKARRQPGSAFKPIIYALALDSGFTPASIINDEPVTFFWGPDGEWMPRNYDNKFIGPTLLRKALAFSRNVITVRLVDEIGVGAVIKYARKLGVRSELPHNLSIALGSGGLPPIELVFAYTAFANEGQRAKPVAIKYITDSRGRIIESNEPETWEVISPQTAFLITSMLKDVVRVGTGWRAKALKRPVAGKTGTTNDFKDAWFMGYTTDVLTGVWVGFDDVRTLGYEETGSRAAAPIWVDFMKYATGAAGPRDFEVPDGIVSFLVDPNTGLVVSGDAQYSSQDLYREYFKKGTEPLPDEEWPPFLGGPGPDSFDF